MIALSHLTQKFHNKRSPATASLLPYRGGKSYLAHRIIALFPPHMRYIEPFFGSGAVFFRKPRVAYEVINDLDHGVFQFFRCLRDQPDALILHLMATPYSRDEFVAALDQSDAPPLEVARRFYVRHVMGFAGRGYTKGDFGVSLEINRNLPQSVSAHRSKIAMLAGAADRLTHTVIEHRDALHVMEQYTRGYEHETLIYLDPPYLPETRIRKSDYQHEMTTEDHERFLDAIVASNAMIAVSGYPSDLYTDKLRGWDLTTFEMPLHSAGRTQKRKGQASPYRTECLWRNPACMAGYDAVQTQLLHCD
jgi:DNA adenine methylase